jgi:glycosyltransferase involved in cell wall biosynthesis
MLAPDRITVVISTYDSPARLEKVLLGYAAQSVAGFEIVIADDGSGPDTRALIDAMAPRLPGPVRHVWHEHHGFQKSKILNRALLDARAPYLVFTDGDCVPRRDFVATHAARARPGFLL